MNTGRDCSPVLTWLEFAECSKRHSCPNCEIRGERSESIGKPERDRDVCIECYAAYVKWAGEERRTKDEG